MTRRDWWAGIAVLIIVGAADCWFLPRHIAADLAAGAVDGAVERIQQPTEDVPESVKDELKSYRDLDAALGVSNRELPKADSRSLDEANDALDKAISAVPDGGNKAIAFAIIGTYKEAFERYKADVKKYPPNFDELPKSTAAGWKGPYIERIDNMTTDPWGHPYLSAVPGKHLDFDIWSCGPDGISGTADDIGNWSKSAYGDTEPQAITEATQKWLQAMGAIK